VNHRLEGDSQKTPGYESLSWSHWLTTESSKNIQQTGPAQCDRTAKK
jgi:hypothetical protein